MKLLRYIADKLYKYSSYSQLKVPICYVENKNVQTVKYELKVVKERNEEIIKKYLALLMQEEIYKFVKINKIEEFDDCDLYRGELKIVEE